MRRDTRSGCGGYGILWILLAAIVVVVSVSLAFAARANAEGFVVISGGGPDLCGSVMIPLGGRHHRPYPPPRPMCGGGIVFLDPWGNPVGLASTAPMPMGGGCGGGFYDPRFADPGLVGGGYNPYLAGAPMPPVMQFGGYGGNPYGNGGDLAYAEEYERQLRRLERDRQCRLEQMARERARRDAEAAFRFGGW